MTRAGLVRAALDSPYPLRFLPVDLTADYVSTTAGDLLVVNAFLDPAGLSFEGAADGQGTAAFDLVGVVIDEEGKTVSQFSDRVDLSLTPEAKDRAFRNGLTYRKTLAVRPGLLQARIAVRADRSRLLGSASQWVAVPDRKRPGLALSSILLVGEGDGSAPATPNARGMLTFDRPRRTEVSRRFPRSGPPRLPAHGVRRREGGPARAGGPGGGEAAPLRELDPHPLRARPRDGGWTERPARGHRPPAPRRSRTRRLRAASRRERPRARSTAARSLRFTSNSTGGERLEERLRARMAERLGLPRRLLRLGGRARLAPARPRADNEPRRRRERRPPLSRSSRPPPERASRPGRSRPGPASSRRRVGSTIVAFSKATAASEVFPAAMSWRPRSRKASPRLGSAWTARLR